jgi:hypothetical protein
VYGTFEAYRREVRAIIDTMASDASDPLPKNAIEIACPRCGCCS